MTLDYIINVYAEAGHKSEGSDYTIRNKTHKYIKFDDGNESLYNLKKKSFELKNIIYFLLFKPVQSTMK